MSCNYAFCCCDYLQSDDTFTLYLSSDDKPVDHNPAEIKKAKRLFAGHAKPVDRLSQ